VEEYEVCKYFTYCYLRFIDDDRNAYSHLGMCPSCLEECRKQFLHSLCHCDGTKMLPATNGRKLAIEYS
jgi:hypothetical protein